MADFFPRPTVITLLKFGQHYLIFAVQVRPAISPVSLQSKSCLHYGMDSPAWQRFENVTICYRYLRNTTKLHLKTQEDTHNNIVLWSSLGSEPAALHWSFFQAMSNRGEGATFLIST